MKQCLNSLHCCFSQESFFSLCLTNYKNVNVVPAFLTMWVIFSYILLDRNRALLILSKEAPPKCLMLQCRYFQMTCMLVLSRVLDWWGSEIDKQQILFVRGIALKFPQQELSCLWLELAVTTHQSVEPMTLCARVWNSVPGWLWHLDNIWPGWLKILIDKDHKADMKTSIPTDHI